MGLGGISPTSLILILVIVLLLFGTKKLRGLGGDLGGAIKGFKKAISEDEKDPKNIDAAQNSEAEETVTQETKENSSEK